MIHFINPRTLQEVVLSKDGDLCHIRTYTPTTGWSVEGTLPRGHEAAYEVVGHAQAQGWVLHPESPESPEEFIN